MKKNRFILHLLLMLTTAALFSSCATLSTQKGRSVIELSNQDKTKKVTHQFILVGDAGNADEPAAKANLEILRQRINAYDQHATLLFLGDNIYPVGMPDTLSPKRKLAEEKLDEQIALAQDFKGKTYFIAGNHDWYNGMEGLQEQKQYVAQQLKDKKAFLPRKYEPIEQINISDSIVLLTIDSEWLMQDWNKYKEINKGSSIKNREDFYEEFRTLINKNQNKITVVAIHHPLFTNGSHGGYFSLHGHFFPYKNIPLPVLGSIGNFLRKTTGASPADVSFVYYQEMIQRMKTIVQDQPKVVFVSGHEHSLQYIEQDGIKQIISGSASKTEEARAKQPVSFSSGKLGYAVLTILENQEATVAFYTTESGREEQLFTTAVLQNHDEIPVYSPYQETTFKASVYSEETTKKSGFYSFLFGQHYRKVFGTPVIAPVAHLDTLYGGLTPLISGGGNQSLSLRLVDTKGRQYVMRGLKKSAPQFLQSALFKDKYIKDRVAETDVLGFIEDFYTTSHPYMPFVVGDLLDAIQVYHSNPKLYYIPKQNALGKYNEQYGDALYMIEERQHKSQIGLESYGTPEDIISTVEVIEKLQKDASHEIDAAMYLRARIFDLLVGDWDRHGDQWRWGIFKENKKTIYRPIPRDRDQVFAKIDGHFLALLMNVPALRHMQNFSEKFASPRWINKTAFPLDKVILQRTTLQDWQKAATYVTQQLSDEKINEAFAQLPQEVQGLYTEDIKKTLQKRKVGILEYTSNYYKELMRYGLVFGTNKSDYFHIETHKNSIVVHQYEMKKDNKQLIASYSYQKDTTKELWIYALDAEDHIKVSGEKSGILLRLIGGRDEDHFEIDSNNKIKLYDYAAEKSQISKGTRTKAILKDNYELNLFDYRQAPINTFTVLPVAGYNPDNGIMLGFRSTYTQQNFKFAPFAAKHQLNAKIDFATHGVIASYSGLYKNNTRNWYFSIDALATTSNYSQNFFGWGNTSMNQADEKGMSYYRVRTEQMALSPSYKFMGRNGGSFMVGPTYESTEIEPKTDRFIDQKIANAEEVYKTQHFIGGQLKYEFQHFDNKDNPSIGLAFLLHYGFKTNATDLKDAHQFISSKLNFMLPLNAQQSLVWSSSWLGKTMIGTGYHFYQAADLGANQGLRGYRNNRFVGQSSFASSNDLRFKIKDLNNGFIPWSLGAYAGFDIGRVWQPNEKSKQWHNSFGGGIWLNALESFTINIGAFSSKEDFMFNFGLGYHF